MHPSIETAENALEFENLGCTASSLRIPMQPVHIFPEPEHLIPAIARISHKDLSNVTSNGLENINY